MSQSSSSGLSILSDTSESTSFEFLAMAAAAAYELDDTAISKRKYVRRDRELANEVLMNDYFVERPKYDGRTFDERFRMSKGLFLKIVEDIETNFEWFQEGYDGRFKKSFTAIQKCTSAVRQLATGNTPDEYDEYLAMSERTSRESLDYFCKAVIKLYSKEFLRRPTSQDIALLYDAHEARWGLRGMLGSIDCTHIVWRNCPTQLRGQYMRGDHRYPTIMLEAVVSNDLWFWHSYFGPAGSNNDLNVLYQSPLFNDEVLGTAPKCPFQVNGRAYDRGYYLADGIYPSWSVFVKSYVAPVEENEKKFKKLQEAARKDVERAFGVIKSKWGILNRPARAFKISKIRNVMYTCLILHNMILKDEGKAISPEHVIDPPSATIVNDDIVLELRDQEKHFRLRMDLVEHIASISNVNTTE